MDKKCIICSEKASFRIKDSNEYYCKDCAQQQFSSLDVLLKVESEAKALKRYVDNVSFSKETDKDGTD
jgi:hypothetical protein